MTQVIIKAVRQRQACVDYLFKYIPDARVVYDSTDHAMITFLDALEAAGEDPCIHLEDDIYLTQDFRNKIESVISDHRDEVVQFFSMRKADTEIGSRYDSGGKYLMNQCFYLPEGYSKMIKEYYPSWSRKGTHPTGTDTLVSDFLKSRRERYYLYVPSLVQHRQMKSVINPRRSCCRQSQTFVDGIYE